MNRKNLISNKLYGKKQTVHMDKAAKIVRDLFKKHEEAKDRLVKLKE